jgi:acetyl-CoA acetyltransferase
MLLAALSLPLVSVPRLAAAATSRLFLERIERSARPRHAPTGTGRAFRVAGPKAFAEAGVTHNDVDRLTIYDAPCSLPEAGFAHLPIYGLEDLGFVPRGEAGAFIAKRNTAPGGRSPLNTNGGGLSYMHSGMYGMYALQENVRQMRGTAPAQIPGAKISVCHGVGGMFAASGSIIMSKKPP